MLYFQCRRISLPEILQSNSHSSTYITGKSISSGLCAGKRTNPGTVFCGPFADAERIVCKLRETEIIPCSPIVNQTSVFCIKTLVFRNAFSFHLLFLPALVFVECQDSSSHQRFNRFAPYTSVGTGEGYMTVI